MSWHQHSGWPVSAVSKLRRAKELKARLDDSSRAAADDDDAIKTAQKAAIDARKLADDLEGKYKSLLHQKAADHRKTLRSLTSEIEKLTREAKDEKAAVPEKITEFIKKICSGVNWSAGFQIVWYDDTLRFVILRLPNRKYWSARSQASAQSTTTMFDLTKVGNCHGGYRIAEATKVREVDGRMKLGELEEWKEYAKFAIA